MRSEKAEMPSRTRILAREATAGGMLHLGVAVRRPPGLRDTTRVHQVGGRALPSEHRAHVAGKGPDSGLIEAMSRRGDVHSVEEADRKCRNAAKTAAEPRCRRRSAEKRCPQQAWGPGGACGQDAAPGSGRALCARPQGHHLSTSGRWMGAPE